VTEPAAVASYNTFSRTGEYGGLIPSIDVGANSAVVKHEGRCCTTSSCIAARAGSGAKASRVLRFM
jgi:hypothetical protein